MVKEATGGTLGAADVTTARIISSHVSSSVHDDVDDGLMYVLKSGLDVSIPKIGTFALVHSIAI